MAFGYDRWSFLEGKHLSGEDQRRAAAQDNDAARDLDLTLLRRFKSFGSDGNSLRHGA